MPRYDEPSAFSPISEQKYAELILPILNEVIFTRRIREFERSNTLITTLDIIDTLRSYSLIS
jgi:hypothetical protein